MRALLVSHAFCKKQNSVVLKLWSSGCSYHALAWMLVSRTTSVEFYETSFVVITFVETSVLQYEGKVYGINFGDYGASPLTTR